MSDGPAAIAAYTRVYEEEQPRLVAYARSLTCDPWVAEDLVAEAHFRVWRRLSAGHEVDNVPAYLTTTVRHLAATVGSAAARETPQDPWVAEGIQVEATDDDPAERISSVDLLSRVLGQLPQRWVEALWLAEAEDVPLEDIGRRIGTKQGATAVLLHRAREGMRQAFLRAHPGTPADPACEAHWARMPAYVRETSTPRQSEQLLTHLADCTDCRSRLATLTRTNDRLPALVGPALLIFVLGGSGKFLLPLAAGAAGASTAGTAGASTAGTAGASAGAAGSAGAGAGIAGTAGSVSGAASGSGAHGGGGLLHVVRHVVTGGSKVPAAAMTAVGATVAGAAIAAGIVLSSAGHSTPAPEPRAAAVQSAPDQTREAAPSEAPTAKAEGGEDEDASDGPEPAADAPRAAAAGVSPAAPEATAAEERTTAEAPAEAEEAPVRDVPTQDPAAPKPQAATPDAVTPEADVAAPAATAPSAAATPPASTPTPTLVTPTPPPTPAPVTPTPTPSPTPSPRVVPPTPTPAPPTPVTPTPTPVEPSPEPVTPTPTPVTPTPIDSPTPVDPTPVDPTPVEPTPEPTPEPTAPPQICVWHGPVLICYAS
ncbi:sigma-70 family RNA polymerase sigma factor [Streptomyces justiciae]|uniref:sigma-70 family RNA polymerase sigma factor n=1 Tax=Streptomyces justiciae TaxID=2780140 RepID=UPI00187F533F|nr:sigma-70 family RNA polymerase sigma factor [Streptomyces justiciae]MBE8470249.1 sigma-70 family RNA polymerase sigma factor [Streptomyces justiciae]